MRSLTMFIFLLLLSSALVAKEPFLLTVYATKYEGRITTSGEAFSHSGMTAATNRRELLGSSVLVCYRKNCVALRINDLFGPNARKQSFLRLDITKSVNRKLGFPNKAWGTAEILFERKSHAPPRKP